tara:strand:+ start:636 stop:1217 length:582 start_codon:yes stop_codon:yes gene_type:complete
MSLETTAISNLPISTNIESNTSAPNIEMQIKQHQNELKQPNIPPKIQEPNQLSSVVSGIQKAAAAGVTNIPSRDIPTNTSTIQIDEQIKPNYIVEPKKNEDYIKNYEVEQVKSYTKTEKYNLDYIIEQIYLPVIVGLLFCLFQIPYIKRIMQCNLAFLYKNDGNLNVSGYLITSSLFGTLYYVILKILDMINY